MAEGEPVRISMCHCLACQRRTGSAFGLQARFPADRVRIEGRSTEYVRLSDEGDGVAHTFAFCPDCGATVHWRSSDKPDQIAVSIGAFADPQFPSPTISVYESRRHPWVTLPATIARHE
ncbi:MAG TPA: GFA family protein [Gaiellales bacterium]|nr:GFA family protein [Gaiellales bacterium]